MKKEKECPKCGSSKIIHISRAVNSSKYDPQMIRGLAHKGTALAGAVLGLEPGALEAYTCRGCGYMELYVREPGSLQTDGETIREVDRW